MTALLFEPLDLLARLLAAVPAPRFHLLRYFGERAGPKHRLGEPLQTIPGDTPLAAPAPRSVPRAAADDEMPEAQVEPDHVIGTIAPEGAQDAFRELKNAIIRLEKTVNAQSRAFRALVDLLQQKGVVRRGELGQRTAKK